MPSTLSDALTAAAATEAIASSVEPKRRVCFSLAAYAKAVVEHFRAAGTPVAAALSEAELAKLEAAHDLEFPPDLRAILREGLPLGPGFPDWRSASPHQLRLLHLSTLAGDAARGRLWCDAWGPRPANPIDRAAVAKEVLAKAPPLVPIYRHFYMPCSPGLAGNPVFLVRGGEVRLAGLDLADFFCREELQLSAALPCAAWAAKSARRIEVWTDLSESSAASATWSAVRGLEGFMKEMGWVLREGGWGEEEVREMMAGASDGEDETMLGDRMVLSDRESVMWHVRLLALALLRAGWSTADVVDSMGCVAAREEETTGHVTWPADPTRKEISIEL